MRRILLFAFICSAIPLMMLPGKVDAAQLYGHGVDDNDGGDGSLYLIDTVAQTVTLIGRDGDHRSDGDWTVGPEIEVSPSGDAIYFSVASWAADDLPDPFTDKEIQIIDPDTGLSVDWLDLSGVPIETDTITAMGFAGNTLYASFHESGPESDDGILATINTSTGEVTPIGAMTNMNKPTGGMSYVNGVMYAISATDNNDSRLFTVNLDTGAATLVANITLASVQQESATGLAYAGGAMYLLLNGDTNLYSVDLDTGELTVEFDMGIRMNSLAPTSSRCGGSGGGHGGCFIGTVTSCSYF